MLRAELKNINNELREVQLEEAELKNLLNGKLFEVEKLKREGLLQHSEN